MSSNNVDASGQMRGWFKLIETIRKTDPPCSSSNELFKPTANSHTNGYPMPIESPQSTSPNFIPSPPPPLDSPPIDDTPSIDVEPEITPPGKYLVFPSRILQIVFDLFQLRSGDHFVIRRSLFENLLDRKK